MTTYAHNTNFQPLIIINSIRQTKSVSKLKNIYCELTTPEQKFKKVILYSKSGLKRSF